MSARTRRHGHRVEDQWPAGLAPTEFHAPWETVPVGPFRIQRWAEAPPGWVRGEWRVHDDLGEAIMDFMAWPVEIGMSAVMLDESFRVVLGWVAFHSIWRQIECPVWYGVRASFAWMEESGRFDPMIVLDHEITAMASAT